MKRKILLLMMTALLSVGAWAENLWSGSASPSGWGFVLTEAKSMSVGDILTFTITAEPSWGGITLNTIDTSPGYASPGTELKAIPAKLGKVIFIVDEDIATAAADGLWLGGGDYTVTSVDYEKKQPTLNLYSNEEGTTVNYWGSELSKVFFPAVQTGDLLMVTIKSVGADWGANLKVTTKDGGADNVVLATAFISPNALPTTVTIPFTNDMVAAAKSNGLYLNEGTYTYTSVDIVYTPTVSIGSTGYATFGYPFAVDLSELGEGQDAYTVTVNGDKAQLTSVKGKKIPAGTGIILKGTNGDEISLPLTTASTDEIGTNDLRVSDGTVTGDENGTIYVLANGDDGVGFYRVENGSAITAGKAYLSVPAGARQFIGFGDDNGATGIQTVANSQQSAANSYYDLQGRRVAQPAKGLYIVNGKKVIIK